MYRYSSKQCTKLKDWIKRQTKWNVVKRIDSCKLVLCSCQAAKNDKQKLTKSTNNKHKNKNKNACTCGQRTARLYHNLKGKKPTKLRVAQALFIVKEGKLPQWFRVKGIKSEFRYNVSHVCGRSLCRNPDHLTLDTQKINLERRKCHENMKQKGWTSWPHCPESHNPKCFYCY